MKKLYNSIEEVIQELNIIHNFKYSYRGLKETLMAKKVKIICPIHGEFEPTTSPIIFDVEYSDQAELRGR